MTFFSIIIPTYRRPQSLKKCLEGLLHLDYPQDLFEVIIIDDGSELSLKTIMVPFQNRFSLTLNKQTHSGPAAARNKGATLAQGDVLAFIDDDCVPDSLWLKALAGCFGKETHIIAGGLTVNALSTYPFSAASQLLNDYLRNHHEAKGRPTFSSNNLAIYRLSFEKLGGFSAEFPLAAGEDREFCTRALSTGMRLEFCSQAVVFHEHHLDLRSFWRQHLNYGRGAFVYHRSVGTKGGVAGLGESPKFYVKLLLTPFSTHNPRSILMFCLLLISQIANALGYFKEHIDRRI